MDRLRILIISGSYPNLRCGVADYVKKLVETLLCRNVDVHLLTSSDPAIQREEYIYAAIKRWNIVSLFKALFFARKTRVELINLQIPTVKYKPIFSGISFFPFFSKLFFRNVLIVVTVHDFAISRPYLKMFFLPLFLFSDKILVTNKNDEDDVKKHFPFLKKKVKKIYMGNTVEIITTPDNKKKELLKKVGYIKEDRFVSTFGFIKPDRYLEIVIKAFSKLKQRNKKLKLLIIGDIQRKHHKKYFDNLIELCKKSGLQNQVFWVGFSSHEEVSFYLSLSSIAILLYERGASLRRSTLINCALRKVPFVTNINERYGLDKDLLDAGIALTVDSLDIDKIREKSELILYDEHLVKNIKQKMEDMGNAFDWENTTDEILSIFLELIEEKTHKCEKKYY